MNLMKISWPFRHAFRPRGSLELSVDPDMHVLYWGEEQTHADTGNLVFCILYQLFLKASPLAVFIPTYFYPPLLILSVIVPYSSFILANLTFYSVPALILWQQSPSTVAMCYSAACWVFAAAPGPSWLLPCNRADPDLLLSNTVWLLAVASRVMSENICICCVPLLNYSVSSNSSVVFFLLAQCCIEPGEKQCVGSI